MVVHRNRIILNISQYTYAGGASLSQKTQLLQTLYISVQTRIYSAFKNSPKDCGNVPAIATTKRGENMAKISEGKRRNFPQILPQRPCWEKREETGSFLDRLPEKLWGCKPRRDFALSPSQTRFDSDPFFLGKKQK